MKSDNFRDIISRGHSVFTIGVAGGSGSGKSTFTSAIREIFGPELISTITLDDYHTLTREERARTGITPLAPEANNIALIEEHLAAIKNGRSILKPVYNHRDGTFDPPVTFTPTKIVIIEGLHALFTPAIRDRLDFSIFVDPSEEVKTTWKIRRDIERRGYRREDVENEIAARMPDYRRYVEPQRGYAEAVIRISPSRFDKAASIRDFYNVSLLLDSGLGSNGSASLPIDIVPLICESDRAFTMEFEIVALDGRLLCTLGFDGELPYRVIRGLEKHIEYQTGVRPIAIFKGRDFVNPTEIIQLLLSWVIIRVLRDNAKACPDIQTTSRTDQRQTNM